MRIALGVIAVVVQLVTTFGAECDYKFWYVNTGPIENADFDQIRIGCLDPGGCPSVFLAPDGCEGCFDTDSACVTATTEYTNLAFGDSVVINGRTNIGDQVCSTKQVTVIAGEEFSGSRYYEWSQGSLAGTKFVYGTNRGYNAKCAIYATRNPAGAAVSITDSSASPPTLNVGINPYQSYLTAAMFDAEDDYIKISSDNPILVSCWYIDGSNIRDFINLVPVSSETQYGFDSNDFRGFQYDCSSLATTLSSGDPVCTSSDNKNNVGMSYASSTDYFEIFNGANFYAGPGLSCTSNGASCLTMITHGDDNGAEATISMPVSRFATRYLVLQQSVFFAIVSNVAASCTLTPTSGSAVTITLTQTTGASVYKGYYNANTQLRGATLVCDNPVNVVSEFVQKEYNMAGLEDEAIWTPTYFVPECSNAPTTSPTSSPTTLSPTKAPVTLSPTKPGETRSPSTSPTTKPVTAAPVVGTAPSPTATEAPVSADTNERLVPEITLIAAIGGVGGLLLLFSIFMIVLYRRRRRKNKKNKDKNMGRKQSVYKNGVVTVAGDRRRRGSHGSIRSNYSASRSVGSKRSTRTNGSLPPPAFPEPLIPTHLSETNYYDGRESIDDDEYHLTSIFDDDGEYSDDDEEMSPMV